MTLFRRQLIRRRGEGAGPRRERGSSQTRKMINLLPEFRLTIFTVIIASPILPLSQTDMAANYCIVAHAVRQQKGCGVSGQPSLSPSFSVATDSPPSPPSSSPSRPLPVPCHSSSPPVSHAGNDVQPSSPPAAVSSPVARAPLRPQRYFSAPKSSRPPFLLPSPPISSLVLPSSPQSLLSSKSPVLLCLILTLVLLLVSAQ